LIKAELAKEKLPNSKIAFESIARTEMADADNELLPAKYNRISSRRRDGKIL
jgi:hypothetical protein